MLRPRFGTRRLGLKSIDGALASLLEAAAATRSRKRSRGRPKERRAKLRRNPATLRYSRTTTTTQLHAWIRQSTTAIQMAVAAAAADPVFTTATTLLPPQTALNVSRIL